MKLVYKEEGITPLHALHQYRLESGISTHTPMTYAGRLDPMAEGLLVILVGDECKEKELYTALDKTYEFEILVGVTTDTGDILGMITESTSLAVSTVGEQIQEKAKSFIGTYTQSYPAYSSKTVGGVQLFSHARAGSLPDVLPTHTVTVYSLTCDGVRVIKKDIIRDTIYSRIRKVRGDFRQQEILECWKNFFDTPMCRTEFTVLTCTVSCSSGMYVRQLVLDIGNTIGLPLLAYRIRRTRVGEYTL